MVPRAPPVVTPPPVLRPDRETLARLASKRASHQILTRVPHRPLSISFVVQPTNRTPLGFEAQTTKPELPVLRPKPGTRATGFKAKPEKTVRAVLRSNHSQTINLGFVAQSRNPHSSSPRARCRPHIAPPNLSIAQPPSTRHVRPSMVLCPKSPTPAMILIAARHAAPTTCTP
jgi:hypothetical protein